jgi:hypothetical protein
MGLKAALIGSMVLLAGFAESRFSDMHTTSRRENMAATYD